MNNKDITKNMLDAVLILSFLCWTWLLTLKYYRFGYNDWDLAIFTQVTRNLGFGSQYSSLADYNFFGDHATFIIFLFVPLFKIVAHPLVLIFAKILAFHVAAFSLYWVASKYIHQAAALFITLTFLIFPPNLFAMMYEFNFDCIGMVLFFWIIYFYLEKKYKPFIITFFFALLIKENVYLLLIMFGIFSLFGKRNKLLWSAIPVVCGLVLFYIMIFHFIPDTRGMETSAFVTRYNYLGDSVGEIILRILGDPLIIFYLMFDPQNIRFLMEMFGVLLPFSLFSPQILFLSSSLFAQHLLSENTVEHTIKAHYSHLLMPFIFLSAVYTLSLFKKLFEPPRFKAMIGLSILVFFVTASLGFKYRDQFVKQLNITDKISAHKSWNMAGSIPETASVIATFRFLAPLSTRDRLYSFHKVYDDRFQSKKKEIMDPFIKEGFFHLPDHVQYAVIDFQDPYVGSALFHHREVTIERIMRFFTEHNWLLKDRHQSILFFERLTHQEAAALSPEDFKKVKINYQLEDGSKSSFDLRVALKAPSQR